MTFRSGPRSAATVAGRKAMPRPPRTRLMTAVKSAASNGTSRLGPARGERLVDHRAISPAQREVNERLTGEESERGRAGGQRVSELADGDQRPPGPPPPVHARPP